MIVSNLKDKSISCLNLKDNVIYEVRDTSLFVKIPISLIRCFVNNN